MSATATERFQFLAENHGSLESPIAHRLLAHIMEQAVTRYYEHRQGNMAEFVTGQMKNQAADILAILELASDWTKDPVAAAGRLHREDIESQVKRRTEALARDTKSAIDAAVQAEADKFRASLKAAGIGNPDAVSAPASVGLKG